MIQATGRDVFAEAVLRLEDADLPQYQLRLGDMCPCSPELFLKPTSAFFNYFYNGSTKSRYAYK